MEFTVTTNDEAQLESFYHAYQDTIANILTYLTERDTPQVMTAKGKRDIYYLFRPRTIVNSIHVQMGVNIAMRLYQCGLRDIRPIRRAMHACLRRDSYRFEFADGGVIAYVSTLRGDLSGRQRLPLFTPLTLTLPKSNRYATLWKEDDEWRIRLEE